MIGREAAAPRALCQLHPVVRLPGCSLRHLIKIHRRHQVLLPLQDYREVLDPCSILLDVRIFRDRDLQNSPDSPFQGHIDVTLDEQHSVFIEWPRPMRLGGRANDHLGVEGNGCIAAVIEELDGLEDAVRRCCAPSLLWFARGERGSIA